MRPSVLRGPVAIVSWMLFIPVAVQPASGATAPRNYLQVSDEVSQAAPEFAPELCALVARLGLPAPGGLHYSEAEAGPRWEALDSIAAQLALYQPEGAHNQALAQALQAHLELLRAQVGGPSFIEFLDLDGYLEHLKGDLGEFSLEALSAGGAAIWALRQSGAKLDLWSMVGAGGRGALLSVSKNLGFSAFWHLAGATARYLMGEHGGEDGRVKYLRLLQVQYSPEWIKGPATDFRTARVLAGSPVTAVGEDRDGGVLITFDPRWSQANSARPIVVNALVPAAQSVPAWAAWDSSAPASTLRLPGFNRAPEVPWHRWPILLAVTVWQGDSSPTQQRLVVLEPGAPLELQSFIAGARAAQTWDLDGVMTWLSAYEALVQVGWLPEASYPMATKAAEDLRALLSQSVQSAQEFPLNLGAASFSSWQTRLTGKSRTSLLEVGTGLLAKGMAEALTKSEQAQLRLPTGLAGAVAIEAGAAQVPVSTPDASRRKQLERASAKFPSEAQRMEYLCALDVYFFREALPEWQVQFREKAKPMVAAVQGRAQAIKKAAEAEDFLLALGAVLPATQLPLLGEDIKACYWQPLDLLCEPGLLAYADGLKSRKALVRENTKVQRLAVLLQDSQVGQDLSAKIAPVDDLLRATWAGELGLTFDALTRVGGKDRQVASELLSNLKAELYPTCSLLPWVRVAEAWLESVRGDEAFDPEKKLEYQVKCMRAGNEALECSHDQVLSYGGIESAAAPQARYLIGKAACSVYSYYAALRPETALTRQKRDKAAEEARLCEQVLAAQYAQVRSLSGSTLLAELRFQMGRAGLN